MSPMVLKETGRVTASNMHAVYVSEMNRPSITAVESICYPDSKKLQVPAILRAMEKEKVAMEMYKETNEDLPTSLRSDMADIIQTISTALLTAMKVHLADFLENGKYFSPTSIQDIGEKTPLTNLVCERNFGDLDAIQRRRPNSSLHHHSSVMLLKQTRCHMREWFLELSPRERHGLWRTV
ncbi:hypothetical protein ElyMa_004545100 [Elysia marginata]|uniref:HAT C-terminal dimerisation domain-containing protein n=1 Tax=Elysia marginata TaxID=1093978 RepID=A0AAV4HRH4_9GAST|nr:hypothetical protein ElyMa_004545100 [Elysia marginata]